MTSGGSVSVVDLTANCSNVVVDLNGYFWTKYSSTVISQFNSSGILQTGITVPSGFTLAGVDQFNRIIGYVSPGKWYAADINHQTYKLLASVASVVAIENKSFLVDGCGNIFFVSTIGNVYNNGSDAGIWTSSITVEGAGFADPVMGNDAVVVLGNNAGASTTFYTGASIGYSYPASLSVSAPTLGAPACKAYIGLVPLTDSAPMIGAPAMVVKVLLATADLIDSAPTIGAGSLGAIFSTTNLSDSAPSIPAATFNQADVLATAGLS